VNQYFTLDARGGVVTEKLLKSVDTIMTERGAQIAGATYKRVIQDMPAAQTRFGKLGTSSR
jgi:hypothetical protein